MHTCNKIIMFLHSATGKRGFPIEDWQNQVSEEESLVKGPGPGGFLFPVRGSDPSTASTLSTGTHRDPQLGGGGGEGGADTRTISGKQGEESHGDPTRGGLNISTLSDRTEDTNTLSETSREDADNNNFSVNFRDTTTSTNPSNSFVGGGPVTGEYESRSESSGQTRTRVTMPVPGPTPASTTVQEAATSADTFLPHLRNIETPTTDAFNPQLLSTETTTTTTTTEAFIPLLRDIETDVTATTSEEESSIIAAIFKQVQDVAQSEEVEVGG